MTYSLSPRAGDSTMRQKTKGNDMADRQKIFGHIRTNPAAAFIKYGNGRPNTKLADLPPHTTPGIMRYVLLGVMPGSFLKAVFSGDRELASRRADDVNSRFLDEYMSFVETECPEGCRGSMIAMKDWEQSGGLNPEPHPDNKTVKVPYATGNSGVIGESSITLKKAPWEG